MAEAQKLRVQPLYGLVAGTVCSWGLFSLTRKKLITVREFIEADDFYKYSPSCHFKAMVTLSDQEMIPLMPDQYAPILDDQDDLQNRGYFLSCRFGQ